MHERPELDHPYWAEIAEAGAGVMFAPSYRGDGSNSTRRGTPVEGGGYPPRNTAGTLLEAARALRGSGVEHLVLCDPDMIVARVPELPRGLAGQFYSYMTPREVLEAAWRARPHANLDQVGRLVERRGLSIGVPYVVPLAIAEDLALAWLEVIDAMGGARRWEDVMYAFPIAALGFGLVPEAIDVTDFNHVPGEPLRRAFLHYCYGSSFFDKRRFAEVDLEGLWNPSARFWRGSVTGELLAQLRECEAFFNPVTSVS